uniref:m7GpppN-mRNA hydrolase n=3 Tax=Drosophila melanogaster TaxID=7227 RepID=Q9VUU4_DROME|nr:decapping protein 2, isoform A [Drosophila melanogaster]AAF49579.4 decapping protein 2, isoform A [Drosophila melanogaster]|eukprot:NP_648805.2 decapping protein 2, isoform A [Drosophila melanogaster]
MEIAPLINNAVAVVTASASAAVSASASVGSSSKDDNVNNLALLASLTLQKVLNINNNNNQHSKNNNHSDNSNSKQHEQQKQQQQPQRRNLDIKSEYDVLNQLLKTGAVFTATPTAPIAIERRKQTQQQQRPYAQQAHQQQQQKQRLNSSISSTHSSTSTNSSYGSSSSEDAAGTSAPTGAGEVVTSAALTPRASTTKASSNKLPEKSKIPSDILDDLASRFIINVPDMELNNLIRMCFQIELAHWFYLDFFCAPESGEDGETPKCVQRKLPSVGIKQFAMQLFQHIPFLNKHFGTVDQILDEWKNYKLSVPTYGAILVSEDHNHCLLVQSYFARNSWGFPKGKINENEDPAHCATREVYEETGFDITDLIDANDYIEAFINYQYTRLYVVRNIPMDTQFAPRTRNEIKCCDWFRIDALPVNKNDAISKAKLGKTSNSFFMIMPFVKRLKKWVNDRKAGIEPRRRKFSGQQSPKAASPTNMNGNCKKDVTGVRNESQRQRHKSMGDLDGVKLNNLNGKGTVGTGAGSAASASATAAINSMNICNSNGKRNKQNAAAGSNQATPTTIATPMTSNGAVVGGTVSSKRQLFHSQSQNDAQQSASNEKIVSSFDLIRKEKQQQLKAAKAQKQQQQQQQRSRTKSQSDKQYNPQQPVKILGQQQPTTGMDLIAMLSAAAAAQKTPNNEQQTQEKQQQQQRPRPASVSLNLGAGSATGATTSAPDAQYMHRLQRMASGTNLRILKRAQSQQPQQHHQQQLQLEQQQQQQQQLGIDFTPNLNSWTNFSFTKNFIANVFC